MRIKSLLTFFPLLAACVTGTISDSISIDQAFIYTLPSVPTPPAGTPIPVFTTTLSQSTTVDVSDAVAKMNKLGTLSFAPTVSEVKSNVDLGFVTHVRAQINSLVVVDQDVTSNSDAIGLNVLANGSDLMSEFGAGPANLSITITVSTANGVTFPSTNMLDLEYVLGLNASESITKGL